MDLDEWARSSYVFEHQSFFISNEFFVDFSSIYQKLSQRTLSDHFPICIMSDGIQWRPVHFRLDNRWLKKEGFKRVVEVLSQENVSGKASFQVAKKLIVLKPTIKEWVREERDRMEEGTNKLLEALENLDIEDGDGV